MIDQFTIDRIMDAAQIVDVVSDFVTLKKRGVNYTGLCPFHDEKTPSFSVSPTKGICKCFSCGEGGNPVHFIMKHEQISYVEALKYLAKKYHIEIEEREETPEERARKTERESMFLVNDFAHQWFQRQLHDSPEGQRVGLSYFRERGFREDIVKKFQLGYSLEQRDALCTSAATAGYKRELLVKLGLALSYEDGRMSDRFRGRVMFPIHKVSGKVVGFGGRILKSDAKAAKYQNSPESDIYHKSDELYGIYFAKAAIVKNDNCFLVEGYTDVIAMHQAGIENVVASSGTALTGGQIRMIHRFTSNITVLYDGDAAGIKASLRGIDLLLQEGMNVKVLLLPDGDDPDSFSRKMSASQFAEYIEQHREDFIRFKINLLKEDAKNDPIKRAAMVNEVVQSISLIPQQIVRSIYMKESAELLNMDEKVIAAELSKRVLALKEVELKLAQRANNSFHRPTPQLQPRVELPIENSPPPFETPPPFVDESYPMPSEHATGFDSFPQESQPIAVEAQKGYPFDVYEFPIIRLLLRYGSESITVVMEGEEDLNLRLIDYAVELAVAGEIEFDNPFFLRVFEELKRESEREGFLPMEYFLRHKDELLSRFAADVSADRHHLSKVHTRMQQVDSELDIIRSLFDRAVYDLFDERLGSIERPLLEQLRHCADEEEQKALMERYFEVKLQRIEFNKHRGDRIITPK